MRTLAPLLALTLLLSSVSPIPAQDLDLMARGDAAYLRRADGHSGSVALPEPIGESITAFEELLTQDPENLEARWKLLRSLYYQGEHVLQDDDERLALYEEAREISDVGREQLAITAGLGDDPDSMKTDKLAAALADTTDSAQIYFWSAVHWGLWGQYRGKMAAAKEGVAKDRLVDLTPEKGKSLSRTFDGITVHAMRTTSGQAVHNAYVLDWGSVKTLHLGATLDYKNLDPGPAKGAKLVFLPLSQMESKTADFLKTVGTLRFVVPTHLGGTHGTLTQLGNIRKDEKLPVFSKIVPIWPNDMVKF